MEGRAVETIVWSSAASSIPSATVVKTRRMVRRSIVSRSAAAAGAACACWTVMGSPGAWPRAERAVPVNLCVASTPRQGAPHGRGCRAPANGSGRARRVPRRGAAAQGGGGVGQGSGADRPVRRAGGAGGSGDRGVDGSPVVGARPLPDGCRGVVPAPRPLGGSGHGRQLLLPRRAAGAVRPLADRRCCADPSAAPGGEGCPGRRIGRPRRPAAGTAALARRGGG